MAEIVGLVVGVVSLGVQLAESTQKVKRFYNAVKDAPVRLADIIEEIESLSEILTEIEGGDTSGTTVVGPKLQRCVSTCRKAVDQFSTYADCLERRIKRHKLRGCTKFALKSESIEGVISRLESSKSNLVLAYMLYREAVADKRAAEMQQQMESIAVGQALLLHQASVVAATPTIPSNRLQPVPVIRSTTVTRLSTPTWLGRTVWELAIARAISGWTVSLHSRRIVPFEAPAALACYFGNLSLLQQVLDRREASPFDVIHSENFGPFSLLETAIIYHHTDVVRSLIAVSGGTIEINPRIVAFCWEQFLMAPVSKIDQFREHFRFLVEQCDSDHYTDTSGPAFSLIQTFASANTEDANIILFWNKILHFDRNPLFASPNEVELSTVLDTVTSDGDNTYLVGHRAVESLSRRGYERSVMARSLTTAYIASAVSNQEVGTRNARVLEELFMEARHNGLDLYSLDHGEMSPMLRFLHSEPKVKGGKDMATHLNAWLTVLGTLGFDLAVYGEVESRLFQQLQRKYQCERPWDFWHGTKPHSCYDYSGCKRDWANYDDERPALFAFSYGATVSDWKVFEIHPGDQYAGQFWQLIEKDDFETGGTGHNRQYVPGGWVEIE